MKNYNESFYADFPTISGSTTRIVVENRYQSVTTSLVSPWVGGKLVKRENPLSFTRRHVRTGILQTGDADRPRVFSLTMTTQTPIPVHPEGPTAIAYSRLAGRVANADFNLAISLATAKQTHDLVMDRLAKLIGGLRALRRGNFHAAARQLGATPPRRRKSSSRGMASDWLELQYGWLPLLSDIKNACGYVPTSKLRLSESATTVVQLPDRSVGTLPVWRLYTQQTSRCRIQCYITVRDTPVVAATELGLTDPLSVAWELVPFSFIVDWFMPVGQYLTNLRAFDGKTVSKPTWVRITRNEVAAFGWIPQSVPPNSYWNYLGSNGIIPLLRYSPSAGMGSGFGLRFDRQIGLPPGSYLRPRFKSPFSLGHFWNGVALLRVLTSRH